MDNRARGETGSDYPGPHFPRYGEQWFECFLCGADYPLSKSFRHYKNNRLVCKDCDDEKTHSDYLQDISAPKEEPVNTEQPVSCQGEGTTSNEWYTGLWYELQWYGAVDPCERKP
jgi:hypothetical protein